MRRAIVKALKPSPRISHCRAALHAQLGGSRTYIFHSIPKSQPFRAYASAAVRRNSVASSSNQPDPPEYDAEEINDQEWELRTGRAIYVLQETLPTFFQTGLVTAIDKATGEPKPPRSTSSSSFHIPLLDPLLHPSSSATPADSSSSSSSSSSAHTEHHEQGGAVEEGEEGVYSPNVRLEYTPPVALPSPFPRTFKVEGLHLYLASASLIRHTMNALYTHLDLALVKVTVHTVPPPNSGGPGAGGGSVSCSSPGSTTASASMPPASTLGTAAHPTPSRQEQFSATGLETQKPRQEPHEIRHSERSSEWEGHQAKRPGREEKRKVNREKYLVVRKVVTGTNRVSGGVSEWEVESTYTFSPTSGLILRHAINWIHPAPHLAVYDSLRGGLGKVFGFGGAGAGVGVGGMGGA